MTLSSVRVTLVAVGCTLLCTATGCSRPDATPVTGSRQAVVSMSPTTNAAATPSSAPSSSSAATTASGGRRQAAPRTSRSQPSKNAAQPMPGARSASYETSAPDDGASTNGAPASGSTYIVECVDENLVREPSSLTLSCSDANEGLSGLTWVAWGSSVASASGMYVVNSCDPSCAAGTPISAPVHLTASAPTRHGNQYFYGRITVTFDATPPPGADAVMVYPLAH